MEKVYDESVERDWWFGACLLGLVFGDFRLAATCDGLWD